MKEQQQQITCAKVPPQKKKTALDGATLRSVFEHCLDTQPIRTSTFQTQTHQVRPCCRVCFFETRVPRGNQTGRSDMYRRRTNLTQNEEPGKELKHDSISAWQHGPDKGFGSFGPTPPCKTTSKPPDFIVTRAVRNGIRCDTTRGSQRLTHA